MNSTIDTQQLPTQRERKSIRKVLGWLGLGVIALLTIGILPRLDRHARAAATAEAAKTDLPVVGVVKAKISGTTADLQLPGSTEPINVARIYARASGYISERRVDIGTRVKNGQALAVIESPELDQQLEQARASLQQTKAALVQAQANLEQAQAGIIQAQANIRQAQANQEIAATTNTRWTRLVSRGVLPKQAGDERSAAFTAREAETQASIANEKTAEAVVNSRKADVLAAQAAIESQAANVRRIERLQSFEHVLAPFDGVVTERKVERGDLVAADTGGDRNLFSVAQASTLRIQVDVPQIYAVDLAPGQVAEVTFRERPTRKYTGVVARTANALDTASRTLLSEVQVNNSAGELLPGMYAQVKFVLKRSYPTILIPGNALVANAQGTRVATLTPDSRVHYVDVQVGRDMGADVEVTKGLTGSEQLIANPADTLTEGQAVRTESAGDKGKKA